MADPNPLVSRVSDLAPFSQWLLFMRSKLPNLSNFVSLLPLLTAPRRSAMLAGVGQVSFSTSDFGSEDQGEITEERQVRSWAPPAPSATRVARASLRTVG